MQNISSKNELRNTILILEAKQIAYKQELKEEFNGIYKKISNVVVIASAIKNIVSSSNNVMVHTTGVVAGYLIKKIIVGKSDNKLRKVIGTIVQFGITRILTRNPKIIEKVEQFIIQNIPYKDKNEENTSNNVK